MTAMGRGRFGGWHKLMAREGVSPWCVSNLANSLWLEDDLANALSWARWATRVVDQESVHPLAWRCLGNVLMDHGRYHEADAAYRRADPAGTSPADQFNRSKVAWGMGMHAQAWRLSEHRLLLEPLPDEVVPGPWWAGWPQTSAVCIWSEQGLGDTLQFARWLPLVLATVPRVDLLVPSVLQPLLQQGLAWMGEGLTVKPRSLDLARDGLPGCHGSLLSLPWRLDSPEPPVVPPAGYIRLAKPSGLHGLAHLGCGRPTVGVLWGAGRYLDGHCRERDYRRKSVLGPALQSLLDALVARPISLVKLQVGEDRDVPEQSQIPWAAALDPAADFLELAEWLHALDLLLCVDTAAAHLAGAMGVRAWVLLPWAAASRWGRNSSVTSWYPSLRLWRQPRHGDWHRLWPPLLEALDLQLSVQRTRRHSPPGSC